jgi:hypothetical protein
MLAPLAGAVGVLIVVTGLVAIGGNWWSGLSRDALYGRAVQPEASAARVATGEPLVETVTVLVRDADGALRRLVTERSAADRFVNDLLRRLDAERVRIRRLAAAEVETVIALGFADADEAVERHADWFFAWNRSYVVLKEAVVATAARLLELGRYEPLQVAVERDLQDYFRRHYTQQVLRPERRDALISRGFEEAARRAHERWLQVVAQADLRLQLFLAEHTAHLQSVPPTERISELTLDWDAQAFRAPAFLTEDKAFSGIVSIGTIGTGGTLGALALRPVIERTTSRLASGLAGRYAGGLAGRAAIVRTGAALGSAVQPVSGTALGAIAGGLMGLAADLALNEADEAFNRDTFEAAHREAVAAAMAVWQDRLRGGLHTAVDRWFDDTRAAVVLAD